MKRRGKQGYWFNFAQQQKGRKGRHIVKWSLLLLKVLLDFEPCQNLLYFFLIQRYDN